MPIQPTLQTGHDRREVCLRGAGAFQGVDQFTITEPAFANASGTIDADLPFHEFAEDRGDRPVAGQVRAHWLALLLVGRIGSERPPRSPTPSVASVTKEKSRPALLLIVRSGASRAPAETLASSQTRPSTRGVNTPSAVRTFSASSRVARSDPLE